MKSWIVGLLLIVGGFRALAGISIQETGAFPNLKVTVKGDNVDPTSPRISIFVIAGKDQSDEPTYQLTIPADQTSWQQEISFAKGYGSYGIHVYQQKDAYSPFERIFSKFYSYGVRALTKKTNDSRAVMSGAFREKFPIIRLEVRKAGSPDQDIIKYTFDNGGNAWNEKIALRQGSGKYIVRAFGNRSVFEDQKQFVFLGGDFEIFNSDSKSNPDLLPSGLVQSEHPLIVSMAQEIVGDTQDPMEKVRLIHDWVASHVTYDIRLYKESLVPGRQKFYMVDALSTLLSRTSICEGYSNLVAALLRSLKIPARVIHGTTAMGLHAWNEVLAGDQWVLMDTTWDAGDADLNANNGLGVFTPHLKHNYFAMAPEKFAQDHQKVRISPN